MPYLSLVVWLSSSRLLALALALALALSSGSWLCCTQLSEESSLCHCPQPLVASLAFFEIMTLPPTSGGSASINSLKGKLLLHLALWPLRNPPTLRLPSVPLSPNHEESSLSGSVSSCFIWIPVIETLAHSVAQVWWTVSNGNEPASIGNPVVWPSYAKIPKIAT